MPPLVLRNSETGETEEIPDYPGIARGYAELVASKRHPTNSLLVAAAERYLRMLEMSEDEDNFFFFSPMHVVDYCRFAERLKHFESGSWEVTQIGEDGEPDPSIILEPWQIWIEAGIQGFRIRRTGERLVSTALTLAPRKSAKSETGCIAILYDLCTTPTAEIPIAAPTEKAADDTIYGDLIKMLNNEPELVEHFKIDKITMTEIRRGPSRIFKLTSQGERQDGLNPSLGFFEEGHKGEGSVYRVIESAFGARPGQLKRMITTAGYRPEGPGYDLYNEAKMVLTGKAEDYTFFAAIYTLDKEDYIDPHTNAVDYDKLFTQEDLLYKANPMMEVSLDPFKIKTEITKAYRIPSKRAEQARTRFNLWVGSGINLLDGTAWAACKRQISLDQYIGRKCWIGVDLATNRDMCAIGLIFEEPTGEISVFCKYYLPEFSPTMDSAEIGDMLRVWAEDERDFFTITEGSVSDVDLIGDEIEAFCEVFDPEAIVFDKYQALQLQQRLLKKNLPAVTYPNSAATMTPPFNDLEGRITNETIWHDGNPILAWNVENVHGDRKGNGLILPRKENQHSPRKIDGFVAICMANGVRWQPDDAKPIGDEPARVSPYSNRGLIGFESMVGTNGQ